MVLYIIVHPNRLVKHDRLVNEGLHLITAYQVAGSQHVVGTLWRVEDKSCVRAAQIVYEHMQESGMTHRSVSEGLHKASRELRDVWVDDLQTRRVKRNSAGTSGRGKGKMRGLVDPEDGPLVWVPYVHYGI